MPRKLTKSYLKAIVCSGNQTPRINFKREFNSEIVDFVNIVFENYKMYQKIEVEKKERKVLVLKYIHKSIQDLISAFNIFISGYPVPSGNLMRHFHESIAMAIIFSCPKLKYYDEFIKSPKKFQVNRVFRYVEENVQVLSIDKTSWGRFRTKVKFFNNYSHSTYFALSHDVMSEKDETLIVYGSHFAKGKLPEYKKYIKMMIEAARILNHVIINLQKEMRKY